MTVATNGQLSGSTHHNQLNLDGTITGAIQNNGRYSITSTYPGFLPASSTGTASINGAGHLLGNGDDGTVFDLSPL